MLGSSFFFSGLMWCLVLIGPSSCALGTWLAFRRRSRKPAIALDAADFEISVLKPMSGLDPALRENLESFELLDAPKCFEVILCLASETDAAYPLAKAFAAHSPGRFKLHVGANTKLGNAKMAQLASAYPLAKNRFIWVSESNVEVTQETLTSLVSTWKKANFKKRIPTMVHAPLVGVHGSKIGAAFERMHLSAMQNPNHEIARLVGMHAVVGKSEFFHRDDLESVGGIEAFGNFLGEDYMFARTFSRVGTVECAHAPTRNVLGPLSLKQWYDRHVRWAVMRKTLVPFAFHFAEPLLYPHWPWLFACAGLLSFKIVLGLTVLRALLDGANFAIQASERPRLGDLAISPFKDLLLLVAWLHALTTFHVKWRPGHAISLGWHSLVLSKTAEPSKIKRHWNQVRNALDSNSHATG